LPPEVPFCFGKFLRMFQFSNAKVSPSMHTGHSVVVAQGFNDFVIMHCSIDATDHERLMKYVNDAPKKSANCRVRPVKFDNRTHILLFASKDLPCDTELVYDYGGLAVALPWRKVNNLLLCVGL